MVKIYLQLKQNFLNTLFPDNALSEISGPIPDGSPGDIKIFS